MDLQILIPLKRLAGAKQRLHPALGGDERRRLMLAMVEHVAREAVAADVGPVALASCEPLAPTLARSYRVGLCRTASLPWNEGLDHARGLLRPAPEAVLYLAGDLPLVSASECARWWRRCRSAGSRSAAPTTAARTRWRCGRPT